MKFNFCLEFCVGWIEETGKSDLDNSPYFHREVILLDLELN